VVHRAALPEDERTEVDGIPVTTVPRTVLDLATVASRRQVERVLNEIEVRQLTSPLSIPDTLARHPGRRGTVVLRELLAEGAEAGGRRGTILRSYLCHCSIHMAFLGRVSTPISRLPAASSARTVFGSESV
jgi:hypothetical protein